MATYKELKAKAEDLMRQAEAARKAETAAVIAEIREKMCDYGITVGDLGGSAKIAKTRKIVTEKYRNPAGGETWSGRGRMPKWLVALESAGRKREEFLAR
ncbi:MAG: H-NS histone family protein [Sulfuritalea sp.]|nr:H-NS histone family protein [Sulfuritalea sp.]